MGRSVRALQRHRINTTWTRSCWFSARWCGTSDDVTTSRRVPSVDALRVFLAAVEHGTLFAAAVDVGRSPQSTSGLVQRMERQLGYRVLRRVGYHGVKVTPKGRALIPVARAVVDAYDQLRAVA